MEYDDLSFIKKYWYIYFLTSENKCIQEIIPVVLIKYSFDCIHNVISYKCLVTLKGESFLLKKKSVGREIW